MYYIKRAIGWKNSSHGQILTTGISELKCPSHTNITPTSEYHRRLQSLLWLFSLSIIIGSSSHMLIYICVLDTIYLIAFWKRSARPSVMLKNAFIFMNGQICVPKREKRSNLFKWKQSSVNIIENIRVQAWQYTYVRNKESKLEWKDFYHTDPRLYDPGHRLHTRLAHPTQVHDLTNTK